MARSALAAAPAGLLTDFDGTLSPIVERPADARPTDGAADALAALARRLAVVGVITGRGALDARRRIGVDRLLIVGNHGSEWLEPDATTPMMPPGARFARSLITSLLERVPATPGVEIEDKGLSATVHVRRCADPEAAAVAVRLAIGDPGDAVTVRDGRMSVELRPAGLGDKGQAVRDIVERHELRGVVVIGDDVTDLDMFIAVAELRRSGAVRGAILAVSEAAGEVPPAVAEAADLTLDGPASVARLLEGLVEP
jgi:trehalose 6-phosphate phosphatase